ncbi:unnamed protein product [Plutella xylostella]|uniref:(diamondback moth) hypothetical protein n=1 Tax=Plutella xylostella TaxID=51655 RepID=A0A8S4GFF9_PLUXY|nr:unnamed protein product [Plutella xylostella]
MLPLTNKYCSGCRAPIRNKECLNCSECTNTYDLDCGNVSIKRFQLMTPTHKLGWKCDECRCKQPKSDNTNTPARAEGLSARAAPAPFAESGGSNVTQRTKQKSDSSKNAAFVTEDSLRLILSEMIKTEIQSAVQESVSQSIKNCITTEFERIKKDLAMIKELKESVEFFSSEYDRMGTQLKATEEHVKN